MSENVSYKGALTSYVITPKMQVHNLKDEISEKQNLYQFKLMYKDSELLDDKFLSKYLITKFTVCYDDKEAGMEINDVSLEVVGLRPEDQRVVTEKVTPEMTVGQFKEIISRRLCPTEGKRRLKKDDKELPDGSLLKTHLEVKTFKVNMQDMQVVIIFDRFSHSIITRSDMTMLKFKRLCASKVKIRPNDFDLISKGHKLNTSLACVKMKTTSEGRQAITEIQNNLLRTLASFGIRNGDMIIIIYMLRCGS